MKIVFFVLCAALAAYLFLMPVEVLVCLVDGGKIIGYQKDIARRQTSGELPSSLVCSLHIVTPFEYEAMVGANKKPRRQ